jgi:pyridoxamine 5'-phosphate oxidase
MEVMMNLNFTETPRTQKLLKATADANPFVLFEQWFAEASGLYQPHGMTLATVSAEGRPSARTVLLKGFDEQGFTFFTNYDSRKAQELAANPWAALLFWWREQHRQVRIEGMVTKVAEAESDDYFATRPHGSQIGAWASPQSQTLANRAELEARVQAVGQQFADEVVMRPAHWGGYRLEPVMFEFWQGQEDRLHDRLEYGRSTTNTWHIERLAP